MIELSHVGEAIISRLLEDVSVRKLCLKDNFTRSNNLKFIPEIRLNPYDHLMFDGVHKVDVSVLDFENKTSIPIEAKLGLTGLSKNEFEKKFLSGCGTSHEETRIKGSMISILERKLPTQCSNSHLSISYQNEKFQLTNEWILVCRQSVLDKWEINGRPNLSSNCTVISFEALASVYGKDKFNLLIHSLLDIDYFESWVGNT